MPEPPTSVAFEEPPLPVYLREYVYLGVRDNEPLVAPVLFSAVARGDSIVRTARAGLGLGPTWDPYLEESWQTSSRSGVWRVLPHGDLHLAVGGAAEIDAIWYRRGERSLRIALDRPATGWQQGNTTRFRLIDAELRLGPERTSGVLLETLQARRPGASIETDRIFLVAGDSLQLVLGASDPRQIAGGRGYAWIRSPSIDRAYEQGRIHWVETRSFEDARRNIPLQWSFRIPGTDIEGEVSALGMDARVGPERPGRRAVEIHYTVEGWLRVGEETSEVLGVVRHIQE